MAAPTTATGGRAVIQLILGHSSRVTTEIYAKLTFTPEVRDRYLQLFEGGAYKQ